MKANQIFLSMLGALCAALCLTYAAATAQTAPDEQAKTILQLFESGQKDTAYALLEPLKKSARFVPAVIYARAQMTPDDRALGLYKELIVLDPDGPWADKALFQLVTRYTEKRDSLAAYTWANVLRTDYPQSASIPEADNLLAGVKSWRAALDDVAEAQSGKTSQPKNGKPSGAAASKPAGTASGSTASKPAGSSGKPAAGDTSRTAATSKPASGKPAAGKTATEKPAAGKPATGKPAAGKPAATTPSSDGDSPTASMRGYALQVGLYPSRGDAQARAAELARKKVTAVALPKVVKGTKKYALVVGPYPSISEATKKKADINTACDCKSFIVQVQ